MAKIINVKVDWMSEWANEPVIQVMFDSEPDLAALRYEERNGLYLATEDGGFADFMAWNGPGNERGYGGRKFLIYMKDGSPRTLLGPWSSNSFSINNAFPETQVVEVNWCADPEVWKRGHTFYSGAVVVDKLIEYVQANPLPQHSLAICQTHFGWNYVQAIHRTNGPKSDRTKVVELLAA